MDKKAPKVAVNVFVLRYNKLLLGKRKNAVGDGQWGLPGGHLEFQEGLEEAAKRELKEETGIEVSHLTFLNLISDPIREDSHYIHINFILENFKGEPQLLEPEKCYEWKWFDLDALPDNVFYGHKKSILAFFKREIFNE